MRIGVFGGSFDPVHVGHLVVANAAAKKLRLERVLFVPARLQPFKIGRHYAAPDDRLAMLRLAITGNEVFLVDRRELNRAGPSFSVDTLRELSAEYPSDELFLLIGADAALDLPQWHEFEELPHLANLVVLSRPGAEPPRYSMVSQILEVPAVDISATEVRAAVARGDSISQMVPPPVAEYIESNSLYGAMDIC